MKATLPTDSAERKNYPLATGCDEYFPAALAGVARHSFLAGARHTPGQPMHHNRGASMDHRDCIRRHMVDLADFVAALERGYTSDVGPILDEANALAWRALAYAQELHERFGGAPLAPAARLPKPAAAPTTAPRFCFDDAPCPKAPECHPGQWCDRYVRDPHAN